MSLWNPVAGLTDLLHMCMSSVFSWLGNRAALPDIIVNNTATAATSGKIPQLLFIAKEGHPWWPVQWPSIIFSPMSPKLFRTYPHREVDQGIDLASLFLWLVLLKLLCNQWKIFVNLTFSQKVWPFVLFWFTSCAELRVLWGQWNNFGFVVAKMSIFYSLLSVIKAVWY